MGILFAFVLFVWVGALVARFARFLFPTPAQRARGFPIRRVLRSAFSVHPRDCCARWWRLPMALLYSVCVYPTPTPYNHYHFSVL